MDKIKIGDTVKVSFHNSQIALCKEAKVLYIPCETGDHWILKDMYSGDMHYISERCTITKEHK